MSTTTVPAQAAGRGTAPTPDAAATTSEATTDPAAVPARRRWSCTKRSGSFQIKTCVKFGRLRKHFVVAWQESLENFTRQRNSFECEALESRTIEFGVSATVEAEAGVIFAKAKTSLTGSFKHSSTSGKVTRANIKVPGRSVRICQRGIATYTVTGKVRRTWKEPGQPWSVDVDNFRARLPSMPGWRIGSPRQLA